MKIYFKRVSHLVIFSLTTSLCLSSSLSLSFSFRFHHLLLVKSDQNDLCNVWI